MIKDTFEMQNRHPGQNWFIRPVQSFLPKCLRFDETNLKKQ